MKLIENHLYSLKRDLASLLVYRETYNRGDGTSTLVFVQLWPLNKLNPTLIESIRFANMQDVTEIEPDYFEESMSLKPGRRHNLMRALWGIK